MLRPSQHQQIKRCAKPLIFFRFQLAAAGSWRSRATSRIGLAAYGPSRAFDPVLPAHLGRIAHTGERRAGRSRRSRDIFRRPGAGGRQPISARRRRPRRHARTYPHGPHRSAARDSDRAGGARPGNLARYLFVRASACAASATDCPASFWGMITDRKRGRQSQFSLNHAARTRSGFCG